MIHRFASTIALLVLVHSAYGQDLSKDSRAAREALRKKQLASSKQLLDHLVKQDRWGGQASLITALFGKPFTDEIVEPLIVLTDAAPDSPKQRLVWHAIAYTQTDIGNRFLKTKLDKGNKQERQLADACLAAVELRKRKVQCDLTGKGIVQRLYFQQYKKGVTRDDMLLVAKLPHVTSVSLPKPAKGALDPLREVTTLEFVGLGCETKYIDEAIECLANSKSMSVLNIRGPVTDRALETIGGFHQLTCLRLNGSLVSDKGLPHLKDLKKLSILELNDTAVTDSGLKHLRGLHSLTYLFLAGTRVTGAGLPQLSEMKKLWALKLDRTRIDDRALGNFQEFSSLQNVSFLYLERTPGITDDGLKHLAAMKKVEGITLSGNQGITSEGISHLSGLGNLKWLNCVGGSVSNEAAEQFSTGRPMSFYISYTNKPGGPIRHEKGRPVKPDDSPTAKLIRKLRRPNGDGKVPPEVIDQLAEQGPHIIDRLFMAVKRQHGIYHEVARVLHRLGPQVIDTLVQRVREDADYKVRSTVTRALYLHGMPVFPRMRKLLKDENQHVRHLASDVMQDLLSRSGAEIPSGLYDELIVATKDKSGNVRRNAVELLYKFPHRIDDSASVLIQIVQSDSDVSTRMRAVAALSVGIKKADEKGPLFRRVVDVVCEASADDESFYVREAAIYYLENLAKRDEKALRALVKATGDSFKNTREKAIAALKRVRPDLQLTQ